MLFTNEEYEKLTYECQLGMYFSNIQKLTNGLIVYSEIVEDENWNFLTSFKADTIDEFNKIIIEAKAFFKKINRTLVISINPTVSITKDVENYILNNYTNFETNVFMITNNIICKKEAPCDYSFRKINNNTESELFVNTFKTSKSQTMPGDTYPPLPKYYSNALLKSFGACNVNWEFNHFVSEYKGQAIGMVSAVINNNKKLCGLYGAGTYIEHRGKGVCSNLFNYVQQQLKQKNVAEFFLLTEKNSKNELFYNYLNFKSLFDIKFYKNK